MGRPSRPSVSPHACRAQPLVPSLRPHRQPHDAYSPCAEHALHRQHSSYLHIMPLEDHHWPHPADMAGSACSSLAISRTGILFNALDLARPVVFMAYSRMGGTSPANGSPQFDKLTDSQKRCPARIRALRSEHCGSSGHESGTASLQLNFGVIGRSRVYPCGKLYSALRKGILLSPASSSFFKIRSI